MAGKLLIDAHYSDETRLAIIGEGGQLENFEVEYSDRKPIKGNIYLAKVVRIEPSIQAAFINYGDNKNGFLPFSEIHHDYFNQNILRSFEHEEEIGTGKSSSEKEEKGNHRHLKIQEVISPKQIILVQAAKEIRGNKCAFFTTFISLPGRYCVLVPNPPKGKGNAISKKIDHSEKERLKEIMETLTVPEGMNCIIRTAGEKRTKQEIKRDLDYLCRLWNEIRTKVSNSLAPSLIHEEGNVIKRGIRDLYQRTMDEIIVQGKDAYKEARAFMKMFTPSHVKKITNYKETETIPLFHKYEIENKIERILDPIVQLPSGGTIVINTTEALTAIDVNSGKSKNERDIEGTALKTNLEAAIEIGRQIKLRDIAGIIVIDFIDMIESQSSAKVEKKMREVMKSDYSSIQFSRLSQFGLMEISRQRLRTSLADATFIQCNHCSGSGKVLASETVALSVIRKIENFIVTKTPKYLNVEVSPGIDLFILNKKRRLLMEMETMYDVSVEISRNPVLSIMDCKFIVKEYKSNTKEKDSQKDDVSNQSDDSSLEIVNKTSVNKQKTRSKKEIDHSGENTKEQDNSQNNDITQPKDDSLDSKTTTVHKGKRKREQPKTQSVTQEEATKNDAPPQAKAPRRKTKSTRKPKEPEKAKQELTQPKEDQSKEVRDQAANPMDRRKKRQEPPKS